MSALCSPLSNGRSNWASSFICMIFRLGFLVDGWVAGLEAGWSGVVRVFCIVSGVTSLIDWLLQCTLESSEKSHCFRVSRKEHFMQHDWVKCDKSSCVEMGVLLESDVHPSMCSGCSEYPSLPPSYHKLLPWHRCGWLKVNFDTILLGGSGHWTGFVVRDYLGRLLIGRSSSRWHNSVCILRSLLPRRGY